MDDVDPMADSRCACIYCCLNVVIEMVSCLSDVIDFFYILIREFGQDFVGDFVIFLNAAPRVFLLHKIDADSLRPLLLQSSGQYLFIEFWLEHLETEEDEADCQKWVVVFNFFVGLIEDFHKLFLRVGTNHISLFIVLIHGPQKGSELNSGISISDIFPENVVDIFSKKMKGTQNREKTRYLLLKHHPAQLWVFDHLLLLFFVQHRDIRNSLDEGLF